MHVPSRLVHSNPWMTRITLTWMNQCNEENEREKGLHDRQEYYCFEQVSLMTHGSFIKHNRDYFWRISNSISDLGIWYFSDATFFHAKYPSTRIMIVTGDNRKTPLFHCSLDTHAYHSTNSNTTLSYGYESSMESSSHLQHPKGSSFHPNTLYQQTHNPR